MKRTTVLIGGLVLIILVAGAAFVAGRSFLGPQAEAAAQSGDSGRVMVIDNGAGPVRITFTEPAALPDTPTAVDGLFVTRQDDSIFVGTGSIELNVEVENGEPAVNAAYDGPQVEVVVTNDTLIYEDDTEQPIIGPEDVARGEMVVARTVKAVDSLTGLGENTLVRAWGERRGDRIIATVLVYEPLR